MAPLLISSVSLSLCCLCSQSSNSGSLVNLFRAFCGSKPPPVGGGYNCAAAGELLDPAVTPDQLLYRLFHKDGVRVFRTRPLRHACRCSLDKVATTLRAFPQAEIEAMSEDGTVTVTCEFCKADYRFDEAALGALYAAG